MGVKRYFLRFVYSFVDNVFIASCAEDFGLVLESFLPKCSNKYDYRIHHPTHQIIRLF